MSLATAQFQSAMKIHYMGPLNDQVWRSHVLLDRLEKNTKFKTSGRYALIPLISGRNPAVGSRSDTSGSGPLLPVAGRQSYTEATFAMALHYGSGEVSGAVRRKSAGSSNSFAEALDSEMQGLMESLPDDLNRQVCGDGSGRAATLIGDQSGSIEIECNARDNFSMKVGDRVHVNDIQDGAGILPGAGTTVASIVFFTDASGNASTTKHTVTLALTTGANITAADDAFYFGAVEIGGTLTNEGTSRGTDMNGIQMLVDDGNVGADMQVILETNEMLEGSIATIGGITRSSNAFWQSSVLHNPAGAGTKRPFTEKLGVEATLLSVAMHGGSKLEGYCHPSVWASIGLTQVGSRIYNDSSATVEMGWEYIIINGKKIFYDRDLPMTGELFLLSMDDIFLLTQGDYELIDDDGSVLRMGGGLTPRDSWAFSLQRDIQLGTKRARRHVRVRDIEHRIELTGSIH